MSAVVGIDPSLTACGIAILRPADGFSATGSARVSFLRSVGRSGRKGDGWDARSERVVAQTRRITAHIPRDGVELVVIEGPSYGSAHGAQMDRHALWIGVYSTLRSRGIPIAVVAPGTREKWATGSVPRGIDRKARKARVLTAVREMFPDEPIRNDDEGDALILAAIGAHHLGWPLPFETKPRHTTGLAAVEWPEGVGFPPVTNGGCQ